MDADLFIVHYAGESSSSAKRISGGMFFLFFRRTWLIEKFVADYNGH